MKELLFATHNDWTGLILRLTVGLVIFPHGAQKMLGMYGGYGFSATLNAFTTNFGLPWIIALLVILIEFFGSIFLIAGFASRLWAFAMLVLFIGIIFKAHLGNGFFMNWSSTQSGEGYEYALLVIGLSIATIIAGSGKYSVDQLISK